MLKGQEIIILEITKEAFEQLYNEGLIDLKSTDFKIKRSEPYKEEYYDNPLWVQFKKESDDAYKKLKELEFKLRHNE